MTVNFIERDGLDDSIYENDMIDSVVEHTFSSLGSNIIIQGPKLK